MHVHVVLIIEINQMIQISKDVMRLMFFIILLEHSVDPRHEISNNVVCATCKGSDQPAHARSLIRAFASRLNIL